MLAFMLHTCSDESDEMSCNVENQVRATFVMLELWTLTLRNDKAGEEQAHCDGDKRDDVGKYDLSSNCCSCSEQRHSCDVRQNMHSQKYEESAQQATAHFLCI